MLSLSTEFCVCHCDIQMRSGATHALNSSGEENMNLKMYVAQLEGQLEVTESKLTIQRETNRSQHENFEISSEKQRQINVYVLVYI